MLRLARGAFSIRAQEEAMSRTLLLATDGRPSADGAVRLAGVLSHHLDAEIEAVGVLTPMEFSALSAPAAVPAGYLLLDENRARDLEIAVKAQLDRVTASDDARQVSIVTGSPASALAERAAAVHASLVVAGTEPPILAHAWRRGATALELVRVSPAPVLVAPPEEIRPPSRVLAAVDFGARSVAAARFAAELLPPGGRVYLCHVTWQPTETAALPSLSAWKGNYDRWAEARLEALASELNADFAVHAEPMLVQGDVATDLVSLADRLDVDMVAAGSQGNGQTDPRLVGSVAAALVRCGRWAVLLTPPGYTPDRSRQPRGGRRMPMQTSVLGAGSHEPGGTP
jgi:nucleotide-binding universal stress UspA family protein